MIEQTDTNREIKSVGPRRWKKVSWSCLKNDRNFGGKQRIAQIDSDIVPTFVVIVVAIYVLASTFGAATTYG